ncbi:MAG TPA: AtzE family amidohydrolase [bacterium]|nr:AtzE family amidohydrolase [bacterium]
MTKPPAHADAWALAEAVRTQQVSAESVVLACLERIAAGNQRINAFTATLPERALAKARALDARIAAKGDAGPLAGVPFAVKNLFDIAGLTTLAGAKIRAEQPPASLDATAVERLEHAGAILVGALNMDEYAYGFVTENEHFGATRNPHDPERLAGGSSGGSAAAVAAGLVPLALGSDTGGSIRVPASLCGVFGFKPTYGRLSRAGAFLFAHSMDHIGPLTRSARDAAAAFDALQGSDPRDPSCTSRPAEPAMPQLTQDLRGLRIAVADGYFREGCTPQALAATDRVAVALGATTRVELPESALAAGAAFVVMSAESANLHLPDLRRRRQDFDSANRVPLLTGALLPAAWYLQAQRFRRWYRDAVRDALRDVDVLVAPTTPCAAPLIGESPITVAGESLVPRHHLGRFTQPLSFIGLPVLSVPVQQPDGLPLGVQLIAAPHRDALVLRVGAWLQAQGVCQAPVA